MAGLLAAMLLVLSLVAARESVAHTIQTDPHHDAGSCFLCLFTHGKLDQPAPPTLPLGWNPRPLEIPATPTRRHFAAVATQLPPGRGPPVRLLPRPQVES